MDRLACVDTRALPLQILLKGHPEWKGGPAAVVESDRPQGRLLYVNEAARRLRVLPGQRFAAALALARDLKAGIVLPAEVDGAVSEITDRLRLHSPEVEPARDAPGTFWLDASGLERLFPSLKAWAEGVAADVGALSFVATVAVGFTRFGTYAVARAHRGIVLLEDAAQEDAALRAVPLARLDLDPSVRDRLARLATRTIGDLLALPPGGLRQRFGDDVHRLHRLASGDLWSPLVPAAAAEPLRREVDIDYRETDLERLLFLVKRLLDELLAVLADRAQALSAVALSLRLDDRSRRDERLRPAAPTLDGVQLLNLLRLRLGGLSLRSGVVGLALEAEGVRATPDQVLLFAQTQRRDRDAVSRAFARLRAELGDGALVQARLRDAHLPQARFSWEPMGALPAVAPHPRDVDARPLVRRVFEKPLPLPPRPRQEPDGWLLRGIAHGRVERLHGPYVVSGGWWRIPVHREYYFAETNRGEVLWIFYDRRRRRFFLEGRVE